MSSLHERRLGALYAQSREKQFEDLTMQCPPIDPRLVAHLAKVFAPATLIKPTHPQLQQLLLVQYGVDMVLEYMRGRYDFQSKQARRDYAV